MSTKPFGVSNASLLVDAIVGVGIPNVAVGERATREGLAALVGNQHNSEWVWRREALAQLSEATLTDLYAALTAKKAAPCP